MKVKQRGEVFRTSNGDCSNIGAMGWIMRSSKDVLSLKVSLEVIANLIYLSRRTETHSAQQHDYLDRAAKVIADLRHHPIVADPAE